MKSKGYLPALVCLAAVVLFAFLKWTTPGKPPSLPNLVPEPSNQANRPSTIAVNRTTNVGEMIMPPPSAPDIRATVNTQIERANRLMEAEISLWQGPIHYFGKVVDENDQPIPDVRVTYGANAMNELRREVYNTGSVNTDLRGLFRIEGVRGIGLMLQLSHPNYYSYPDNSTGFDKRSVPKKGFFSDTEEKCELFRMHKKGRPAPLVHRRDSTNVPINNGAVSMELYGEIDRQPVGRLEIEAHGDTPEKWGPNSGSSEKFVLRMV